MKRFINKKAVTIGLASGLALGTAGTAFALWSATGGGAGTATAYTAQASVASAPSPSPTADNNLWPGDAAGTDLHFNVTNPNPYPVEFTGWSSAVVSSVSGGGTCLTTDFSVTASSASNTIDVPANTTTQAATLPAALKMNSSVTGTNCQGAVVTVSFILTGGTQTT